MPPKPQTIKLSKRNIDPLQTLPVKTSLACFAPKAVPHVGEYPLQFFDVWVRTFVVFKEKKIGQLPTRCFIG
jgi:hypothetical protein